MTNNFETKDSGQKKVFSTGMQRDSDANKPDLYLWMPKCVPYKEQLFVRVGHLAQRGAQKYGSRNYEKACTQEELERFKSSGLRHMMQWLCGEEDEDHAAAVIYALMGAEMVKYKLREGNGKTSNKDSIGIDSMD